MTWVKSLRGELEQLPDTLAVMREASANIKQVSEDLTVVVASLRRITEAMDAAGLVEATEAIQASAGLMRSSVNQFEQMNESFVAGLSKLPGAADFLRGFRGK